MSSDFNLLCGTKCTLSFDTKLPHAENFFKSCALTTTASSPYIDSLLSSLEFFQHKHTYSSATPHTSTSTLNNQYKKQKPHNHQELEEAVSMDPVFETLYRAARQQDCSQSQALEYARNVIDTRARDQYAEEISSGSMSTHSRDRYGRRRDEYLPSHGVDSRVRAVRESYACDERERTREVGYGRFSSYTSASRHEELEARRQEGLARRVEEFRRDQAEIYGTSDYGAQVRRREPVSHGHGSSGITYGREKFHGNPAGRGYAVRAPEPSRSRASDPFEYDEWDDQEYGFGALGRRR
jgi:hypothetical protein